MARFIVSWSMLAIVGSLVGRCDVEETGFLDGLFFVDLNFVGVCLMCPFEVIGDGRRYLWTVLYVM